MKKIHIYTNSEPIIRILSKFFVIKKIFTQKKTFSSTSFLKSKVKVIDNPEKIPLKEFKHVNMAISFSFGIIFKKKLIERYSCGIWNIHPGDLPNYRGRHPISWAILNNEKKIGVCIHIINEKIDRGLLLAKKFVSRTYNDDGVSVQKKILKIIPSLIKLSIQNFEKKNFVVIKNGKYFPSLVDGLEIKNPKYYNYINIYNIIKSQKQFGGVLIGNIKFKDVLFFSKKKHQKNCKVISCKNNRKLIGIV